MVPYCVQWESLGFFFTEYFVVFLVFFWYLNSVRLCFFWMYGYPSYVVSVWVRFSWDVLIPRDKDSSFCIVCSQNDRELRVVNPSLFPIDLGLHHHEPGIP